MDLTAGGYELPSNQTHGFKYTLAVYALLEAGFNMSEIRRVIKF